MEITANLLKLANEWIIAQVDEVEGATTIGDPDCILRDPFVVDCDGGIDEGGDDLCIDNSVCNGLETCQGILGCQSGTPVDCSENNIGSIGTCFNDPDNNIYTWDQRDSFESQCQDLEEGYYCTWGDERITHTCDVFTCGAECSDSSDCLETDCDYLDGCYSE